MSDVELLAEKLRRFAKTGRERRSNVAINSYHADVFDEAADMLEILSKPSPTRNATIEECAAVVDQACRCDPPSPWLQACRQIAQAIRNLKSLPPSPSVNEDGI